MRNFEQNFQNKLVVPQNNYVPRILIIFPEKYQKNIKTKNHFFIFENMLQGFYFGHLKSQKIPI